MAIFRWRQNWMPFHDLEQEVDRLLESIRLPFPGFRVERQFPPCNLYELAEEYLLISEVSGITASELELTIANGLLTLKGRRVDPADVPDEKYRRRERIAGTWERSFALPDRILEEKVSAEYTDGVLKIHLPKPPAGAPRQIPVLGTVTVQGGGLQGGDVATGANAVLPSVPKTVFIEQEGGNR